MSHSQGMRSLAVVALSAWICLTGSAAEHAEQWNDFFEDVQLSDAWTMSTVLSQGAGAAPEYAVSAGRLIWRYESGTPEAQQTVLLRSDVLPRVGQAVQVQLFPEDYKAAQQDFAGLALSVSGASLDDRTGLLLLFFEPSSGQLRYWFFGEGTDQPSLSHSATPTLSPHGTFLLRMVRVGKQTVRASWSTDGQQFHWLPAVRVGPPKAIGLYNGNSRNGNGNRLAFDDFQLLPCHSPDQPQDDTATTPSWTLPTEFLLPEGQGGETDWPAVRPEARPGAYWWWPGSAVTKEDLTWNLETYRKAGWGNLGVIGIYGVRGQEDRFIDIFSPRWFQMFNHTVAEAKRLGMNIDLTPSSGWRMGGPHVTPAYGEQHFTVENGRIEGRPNGAKVKRAGPGGKGLTINPYSRAAVTFHLDWIDKQFAQGEGASPRAFYYDSFENPGNWCPEFLEAFRRLRGYRLEEHAAALSGQGDADEVRRVVCDYRETLSDLLIARVEQLVDWGKQRGSGWRMQAHGAPANLLDMYAAAAIPETEVFGASQFDIPGFRRDPKWIRPDRQSDLVNRFASSAAHVAGRKVVISESFTWLRNHFHTALSHIKAESDNLLLNGINCIYYHGICYAPQETAWPGWLFYASTQGNARNSIFRDVPALNAYLTRCQSVLQAGTPHNDVLLYWPVYDLWMGGGTREQRFSVHHPEWIEETACGQAGQWMIETGYSFDFISDRQLGDSSCQGRSVRTSGGSQYRAILVPAAKFIKLETARHLLKLARAGATLLIWKTPPVDVPGRHQSAQRRQQLRDLLSELLPTTGGMARVGKGRVIVSDQLDQLLAKAGLERERLADHGLKFIRRQRATGTSYFLANHSSEPVMGWVSLASPCRSALLLDPMTGQSGVASVRSVQGGTQVYLQMWPGESRVLRTFADKTVAGAAWPIQQLAQQPIEVTGRWNVEFVEGGPVLPRSFSTDELSCWTQLGGQEAERFAGAARYSTTIDLPDIHVDGWVLQLGDVRESARVWVNDKPAGIVVAHPFRIDLSDRLRPGSNELSIEVTNLSANRIRDLDIRGVDWKKFHDINIVNHMYKSLDASQWAPKPSGLLGPVTLTPYHFVDTAPPE